MCLDQFRPIISKSQIEPGHLSVYIGILPDYHPDQADQNDNADQDDQDDQYVQDYQDEQEEQDDQEELDEQDNQGDQDDHNDQNYKDDLKGQDESQQKINNSHYVLI